MSVEKATWAYDPATDSVVLQSSKGEKFDPKKILMVKSGVFYSEEKGAAIFSTDSINFYIVRDAALLSRMESMIYAGIDGRYTPGRVYNFYFDTKDTFAYIMEREGSVPYNLVQQIKLDENLYVYLEDVGRTWQGIQAERAQYLNRVYTEFAQEYVKAYGGTIAEAKIALGHPLTQSDITSYAQQKGITIEQASTVLAIKDPKQRDIFIDYLKKGYDINLIPREIGKNIYEQYKSTLLKGGVVSYEVLTNENKQIVGFRELKGEQFTYYLLADTDPNFRIQSLNVNTLSSNMQSLTMKNTLYAGTSSNITEPQITEMINLTQLKAQVITNYRELETNKSKIEEYRSYIEAQINKALLASGMAPVARLYFSGELKTKHPELHIVIERYATNLNFTRENYLELLSSIDTYGEYVKQVQSLPSGVAVKLSGIGTGKDQYYVFESEEKAKQYVESIKSQYEKEKQFNEKISQLDKYYSQWYHPTILKSVREFPVEQYNSLASKPVNFNDYITLTYTDEMGVKRTVDMNLVHFTQLYKAYQGLEETKPLSRVSYTQEEIDAKIREYITNIPLERLYGAEKITVPIDEFRTIEVDAKQYINERAKQFETLKLSDITNVFGINTVGNMVGNVASNYVQFLEISGLKKEVDKVTLSLGLPEVTSTTTNIINEIANTPVNLGDLTIKETKGVPIIEQLHNVFIEDKLLTIQQAAIKTRDFESRGHNLEASIERIHAVGGVGVHTALDVMLLKGITSVGVSIVKGTYELGVKTATTTLAKSLEKEPLTILSKDSIKIISGNIDEITKTAKIGVFTYTDDAVKASVYLTEKVTTDDALRIVSNTLYTSVRAVGDYATYPILTRAVINPVTNIVLGTEKAAKIATSLEKVERIVQGATLAYDLTIEDRFGKREFLEDAYRYTTFQMRGDERAYFGGTLAVGYLSMKGFEHQMSKLSAEKQSMAYLWSPVTFSGLVVSNLPAQNFDIIKSIGYSIEEWKAIDVYGKLLTFTPKSEIGMYVYHREIYPSERKFNNYPVYHEYDPFTLKTSRIYDKSLFAPKEHTLIGTTRAYSEPNYDMFIKENLKRLFGDKPSKPGKVTIEPAEKKTTDAVKPTEISIKDKEIVVKDSDTLQKQITKQIEKTAEKTLEQTKELTKTKQKILKKEDVVKPLAVVKDEIKSNELTVKDILEKQRLKQKLKTLQKTNDLQKEVEKPRVAVIEKPRTFVIDKQKLLQKEKQRVAEKELQRLALIELARFATIEIPRTTTKEIPRFRPPDLPRVSLPELTKLSNLRILPFLPLFGGGGIPKGDFSRLLYNVNKRLYKPSVGGIVLDIKTNVQDLMKGIGVRGKYVRSK